MIKNSLYPRDKFVGTIDPEREREKKAINGQFNLQPVYVEDTPEKVNTVGKVFRSKYISRSGMR